MRRLSAFSLFLCLLLIVGISAVQSQESNPAEVNRANILAAVEYVRNRHMLDLANLLYHPTDFVAYSPTDPYGIGMTPAEFIAAEQVFLDGFPDLQFTSYFTLAEGSYTALIGFQEGTFEGEYAGIAPTGQQYRGHLIDITHYDANGLAIADYNAMNQQETLQFLGLVPADYTFDIRPWDVSLGTTSSTPAEHHRLMQAYLGNLARGTMVNLADFYAPDVVAHDYLGDLVGAEAIIRFHTAYLELPHTHTQASEVVCEGDLCALWGRSSVEAETGAIPLVFSALYRFEDEKIVEEWWLYDNATFWSLIPPSEYMQ